MKAISIRQPWAYAILNLGKDVENRTWKTKYRGLVLIHAGLKVDKDAVALLKSQGHELPETFEVGGLVGIMEIVDCKQHTDSKWHMPGHWGWIINDFGKLPFRPFKGKLSFFETGMYAVERKQ